LIDALPSQPHELSRTLFDGQITRISRPSRTQISQWRHHFVYYALHQHLSVAKLVLDRAKRDLGPTRNVLHVGLLKAYFLQ